MKMADSVPPTRYTKSPPLLPCVSNLRQLEKRTSHFDTNKETRYFWDFSFDYQPINILLWITSLFISVLYELILWSISLWYCVQSMQWLFVQFRCLELNSDNKCTFKWTDKTGDFFIIHYTISSSITLLTHIWGYNGWLAKLHVVMETSGCGCSADTV